MYCIDNIFSREEGFREKMLIILHDAIVLTIMILSKNREKHEGATIFII